jgi:Integrase core domain
LQDFRLPRFAAGHGVGFRSGTSTSRKCPAFQAPGHRATGDRSELAASVGAGYQYLHCVLDDHSRFVHVELRQGAEISSPVHERALAELAELGLGRHEAVMIDNAFVYTKSRRFRALLAAVGVRQILTPPYTPRWNGKVERFIGTFSTSSKAPGARWPDDHRRRVPPPVRGEVEVRPRQPHRGQPRDPAGDLVGSAGLKRRRRTPRRS